MAHGVPTIAVWHVDAVEVADLRVDSAVVAHEATGRDGRAPATCAYQHIQAAARIVALTT